jgi:hypothetical protein
VSPLRLKKALQVLFFAASSDGRALSQTALTLRGLLGQDVTLESLHALDLSCSRNREALSRSTMAFIFGIAVSELGC